MPTDKPDAGGRKTVPLFLTLPSDEAARVRAYAAKVGRPISWTVRDALRLYLDAMEKPAAELRRVKVDPANAGKTEAPRRGRPPKKRANVR